MPIEVARYYSSLNVLSILQIELPCKMDAFGIIRQHGRILSPSAALLLAEIRKHAHDLYGSRHGLMFGML
jgi:hypothetical protein